MSYISIIKLFLLSFSLQNINAIQKICINCKNFIPSGLDDSFGKCLLFPRIEEDKSHLVTGIKKEDRYTYRYCELERKNINGCGEEGFFYQAKDIKRDVELEMDSESKNYFIKL